MIRYGSAEMSRAGSEIARSTPLRSVIVPRWAVTVSSVICWLLARLAQRAAAQRRRGRRCARRPGRAGGRTARRSPRSGAGRSATANPWGSPGCRRRRRLRRRGFARSRVELDELADALSSPPDAAGSTARFLRRARRARRSRPLRPRRARRAARGLRRPLRCRASSPFGRVASRRPAPASEAAALCSGALSALAARAGVVARRGRSGT